MIFNWVKTIILFGALSSLIMLFAYLIGGHNALFGAAAIALLFNGIAYFFSDRIVMRMYNAQPLTKENHPPIYAMAQQLAGDYHMPMPKLFIIESPIANAFATGRNPKHASVAITKGIVNLLEPYELRAVLAHEFAHIANRDVLIGTIAAMMASIIGYLAYGIRSSALWGNNRKRSGVHTVILILVSILVPFIATLIQLAISRSREYEADATGAHCCKDPLALASALAKMEQSTKHSHFGAEDSYRTSMAHLFIVYPFADKKIQSLFSTHPPISARIARLHTIYEKQLHV